MTLIIANITEDFIALAVDSVVTTTVNYSKKEYDSGKKAFPIPGVGIVVTWGIRNTKLGPFLDKCNLVPRRNSVEDLKACTWEFLTTVFEPHFADQDEVGYFVLGFKKNLEPYFYSLRWGYPVRNPKANSKKEYCQESHTEDFRNQMRITYDGKFGIAHNIVSPYIKKISKEKDPKINLAKMRGRVQFNDLVLRHTSEITKEVGPPFHHFFLNERNKIGSITNRSPKPLSSIMIEMALGPMRILRFMQA